MKRGIIVVLACAGLSACASLPETRWVPRDDADLRTDLAACVTEADQIDMRATSTYTDGRYGAGAAMTAQMQSGSQRISEEALYRAARDRCMKLKGWVEAQ